MNKHIQKKLEVAPIEDKMRENRLRFGHVQLSSISVLIRKVTGSLLMEK